MCIRDRGYSPGVAVINDMIVGIENSDGNTNVRFNQKAKRANAKLPAYKQLLNEHFEVFTPMKEQLSVHGGKRTREEVPFIQDLLFRCV